MARVLSAKTLHRHPLGVNAAAARGSEEIGTLEKAPDRLMGSDAHPVLRDQAERRLRPRALRAAMTLRPPTVAMRAR